MVRLPKVSFPGKTSEKLLLFFFTTFRRNEIQKCIRSKQNELQLNLSECPKIAVKIVVKFPDSLESKGQQLCWRQNSKHSLLLGPWSRQKFRSVSGARRWGVDPLLARSSISLWHKQHEVCQTDLTIVLVTPGIRSQRNEQVVPDSMEQRFRAQPSN